jgi:cytochrome c2
MNGSYELGRIAFGVFALLFVSAAAFGGYMVAQYRFFPYQYIRAMEIPLRDLFRTVVVENVELEAREDIETTLLSLRPDGVIIPVERAGAGGGLTSVGDDVVLMTHEGKLFAATSSRDVELLDIGLPENGYDAYAAAVLSSKYNRLLHKLEDYRDNDITYVETAGRKSLFVSYTEYDGPGECYTGTVARLELDPDMTDIRAVKAVPEDWEVVFRTTPCLPLKPQCRALEAQFAGGRMAFVEPSTLYLSVGDYGWDGECSDTQLARDLSNDYGKVIAIDTETGQDRIVSIGHRNMQGIAVAQDGRLWAVEHGPRGGDELNLIDDGGDYGWPDDTLGTAYDLSPWPFASSAYGRHDAFTGPVFAWLPSVAPSTLAVIRGFDPSWDGDLIMGTLREQSLFRIRLDGDAVTYVEQIWYGKRIRAIQEHTDGRLVVWSDDKSLTFLTPMRLPYTSEFLVAHFDGPGGDTPAALGARQALATCMQCHSLRPGENAGAPSLADIHGAGIASGGYASYSAALGGIDGKWDDATLARYLAAPDAFASGTTMPDPGIDDPAIIDEIVRFLRALRQQTAEGDGAG